MPLRNARLLSLDRPLLQTSTPSLLSLDRPLLQTSTPSSPRTPDQSNDATDNQSNQNLPTRQINNHLSHLRQAVESFENTQHEDAPAEEDGQPSSERTGTAYKEISTMLIRTNMSIYHLLKYLDQRTMKAEVALEAQSGLFDAMQELSDRMDRFNVLVENKEFKCPHSLLDEPTMDEHLRLLNLKMNNFHDVETEQGDEMVEKLDEIHEGVSEVENNLTGRLHHIHQVQIEQQKALMETLAEIRGEHEKQQEMLDDTVDHMHGVQIEEHETVMEKLEEVYDRQMEQENTVMEKLNELQMQQESPLVEKLNEIQKQQSDTESSHSKWSVLMYGTQERILDRLGALEEMVNAEMLNAARVSELGNVVEERDGVELQDGTAAIGPESDRPKTNPSVPAADPSASPPVEVDAAQVANPNGAEQKSSPLGARRDFLCLCFLVILMLVGLPCGY